MSETAPIARQESRTALVLGGRGFIGSHIVSALRVAGWHVICAQRQTDPADPGQRAFDLAQVAAPDACDSLIEGVDAVINAAGILREHGTQRFDAIHHDVPLALARACVKRAGMVFVQISALGIPEDGEFIASKHRFDAALRELPLRVVVLRPSVVYSVHGSYGGTSLLRALSAFPLALPLPGKGAQRIQPVAAEDLADLVMRALETEVRGTFEVGSAHPLSLRTYLLAWRGWLRIPGARCIGIPERLVSMAVEVGERVGNGPMGRTVWRMLARGNICADDAHTLLQSHFGIAPRALTTVLSASPSHVQDRWHARLHLLAPLMLLGIIALFLISAWVGLTAPAATIEQMARGTALEWIDATALARAGGFADLLLALWLASGWRRRGAVLAMLALVSGYTLVFGLAVTTSWLDPLGGLAKNLVVLPALALIWIVSERR